MERTGFAHGCDRIVQPKEGKGLVMYSWHRERSTAARCESSSTCTPSTGQNSEAWGGTGGWEGHCGLGHISQTVRHYADYDIPVMSESRCPAHVSHHESLLNHSVVFSTDSDTWHGSMRGCCLVTDSRHTKCMAHETSSVQYGGLVMVQTPVNGVAGATT